MRFLRLGSLVLIVLIAVSLFSLNFYRSQIVSQMPYWQLAADRFNPVSLMQEIELLQRLKSEVFGKLTKVEGESSIVWAEKDAALKSQFADAFVRHINSLFPSKNGPKTKIYLFEYQKTYDLVYKDFLRLSSGYEWGWFKNDDPTIFVNVSRGYGTLARYLGIQVYENYAKQKSRLPAWFETGFYTYMEKFVAHVDADNNMSIMFGYLSGWRFQKVLDMQDRRILPFILNPSQDGAQSALGVFVTFIAREGWLEPFIIESQKTATESVLNLEKVSGLKLPEIDKKYQAWIKERKNNDIGFLEQSLILTRFEYSSWSTRNLAKIKWNENAKAMLPE